MKSHVPAPLSDEEKRILSNFYGLRGVRNGSIKQKLDVFFSKIGKRKFICDGKSTKRMELRANERIYLLEYGNVPLQRSVMGSCEHQEILDEICRGC